MTMTDDELRDQLANQLIGRRIVDAALAIDHLRPIIARDVLEWVDSSTDGYRCDKGGKLTSDDFIDLLGDYLAARGGK